MTVVSTLKLGCKCRHLTTRMHWKLARLVAQQWWAIWGQCAHTHTPMVADSSPLNSCSKGTIAAPLNSTACVSVRRTQIRMNAGSHVWIVDLLATQVQHSSQAAQFSIQGSLCWPSCAQTHLQHRQMSPDRLTSRNMFHTRGFTTSASLPFVLSLTARLLIRFACRHRPCADAQTCVTWRALTPLDRGVLCASPHADLPLLLSPFDNPTHAVQCLPHSMQIAKCPPGSI